MAREMKHSQVAKLLNQNLKEEKAALKQMEGFEKKIKPDQMMDEEQESRPGNHRGQNEREPLKKTVRLPLRRSDLSQVSRAVLATECDSRSHNRLSYKGGVR